jgi:indole-3-glycerol phosphate synthase
MTDILARICADKHLHIANRKAALPEASLREKLAEALPLRPFHTALRAAIDAQKVGLIAEIKRASPSRGMIREGVEVGEVAAIYQASGATCLSVLTDTPYFAGEDHFIAEAKARATLPVLRKDFMLDPYQILESRVLGADCVLLIMAALSLSQAQELEQAAQALGMDVLLEVHNAAELEQALCLTSPLIGINNRNLKTLEIDISLSEALVTQIPEGHTVVCESGIATSAEVKRMQKAGIHCFLVGESLMRAPDIGLATRALLG